MILENLVVTWIFFTIAFLIAKKYNRLSIVDTFWGLSFMVIAGYNLIIGNKNTGALIVSALVFIWGVRLASHISIRNFNKKEDYRYQNMRDKWDNVWKTAYFRVFLLQGILMLIIAYPIIIINQAKSFNFNLYIILGIIVWIIGFLFESIGDYQLKEFIKNRNDSKKIMTKGLWAYTRHPNYFGEVTMWWGIFIIVFATTKNIFTIISPLLITFLILKVSGVPLLEKKYENRKGFKEYKEKTNKFFPWFPKK